MADYYSVLARAVVNLDTGDGAAREELYERARSIIVAELRKQNPKIAALTITREQAALEAAIRRLEAELQPWRRSPSVASSICAVSRSSMPTLSNIRFCLALWQVSDVYWFPYPAQFFGGSASIPGAPFPPDNSLSVRVPQGSGAANHCSTERLHLSSS